MIRIVVICEREQERRTIRARLSSHRDFQIVSVGRSGYDALHCASAFCPDIIIMDMRMSDISGTELAPIIKRKSPMTGLIALCSNDEIEQVKRAFTAGIAGFLFTHTDIDKLAEAIRTVQFGGYYFNAPVKQYIFTELSAAARRLDSYPPVCFILEKITPTERKIINYVALGYLDKEIADNLHLAVGTVRNILAALRHKAGLKNRVHIITCAHLCGLLCETPDVFLEIDHGGH